MNQDIHRHIHI